VAQGIRLYIWCYVKSSYLPFAAKFKFDSTPMFLLCSHAAMASQRPASWRFPTPKQARAEETARRMRDAAAPARTDEDCWWDAVLSDPRAVTSTPSPARTLGEIRCKMLRVECIRCMRTIEISRSNAVRLFGPHAVWKDVGLDLLARGCEHRSGRLEEDGCWPDFRS
jgi:hypothetical protein